MSENSRRKFLSKLGLAATGAAALPLIGKAAALESAQPAAEPQNPILRIKALGFQWDTSDPFLFCVHHEDKFPKGNKDMGPACSLEGRTIGQDFVLRDGWRMYHGQKIPGFPGHPHRGFETITVVRKGMVDHTDSMGASGRYGDGDVQWMTAGGGVQHAEMFPLLSENEENPMELFQIWLNLPKKNKMVQPHFKMLWADKIPIYRESDGNNRYTAVEVIAGTLKGKTAPAPPPDSWANDPANEVAIWNIKMTPEATWTMPKASPGINRTIFFYEGDDFSIAGTPVSAYHAAEVRSDADLKLVNGSMQKTAKMLVLQGKPIAEPIVRHGPFVMNTREEIDQAFADYQRTQFGGWPWSDKGPVHDRTKGRFANHADGQTEIRG